tara:strand:+ start:302 stop:604 length:303 start_codon:yes stop_codon:yes gene_type:complete
LVKKTLLSWEIDEIIHHMNDDHADSLLLYARHYGGYVSALAAELVDVSQETCTLLIKEQSGCKSVTVDLKRPVANIKEAELVMVEMHFDALRAETAKTQE